MDFECLLSTVNGDSEAASVRGTESGMTPSGTKTYAEEILSRLVASERAWIPFRDAESNFKAADMLGGTAESAVYSSCLTEMTKQRVFSINSWRHN
jgi:uncharacterized protein YecT (DUF1311 family)